LFIRLSSEFGKGQPLADDLRYGQIEAASVTKVFPIVENGTSVRQGIGINETVPR
jgi:hypothetical protein